MNRNVNRGKRVRGMVLFFLFVLIVAWGVINRSHILAMAQGVSSYYSKEFCSCYFVVGNSEQYCHGYLDVGYPISSFSIDQNNKTIDVSAFGFENKAHYFGKKYGCGFVERDGLN